MKIDLKKQQIGCIQSQPSKHMLVTRKEKAVFWNRKKKRSSVRRSPGASSANFPVYTVTFMVWDTPIGNSGQLPWLNPNC